MPGIFGGGYGGLPKASAAFVTGEQIPRMQRDQDLQGLGGIIGLQNALMEQQLMPLKIAQLQEQLAQAQRIGKLREAAFSGGGMSAPQSALAVGGAQGDIGPTQSNAARIPQMQQGGGVPQNLLPYYLSGDPGMLAYGRDQAKFNEPRTVTEGGGVFIPGQGFVGVRPKVGEGMRPTGYGPTGELQGVEAIPGYTQSRAAILGAETGAQEQARAERDIVQIPGQPVQTRAQVINRVAPSAPRAPAAGVPPGIGSTFGGVSPLTVPTPAETAAAVETGKGRAESGVKFENAVLEGGRTGRQNLTQLQILAPNLEKLPTGPMYPLLASGASYFKQFGIDVGNISKNLDSAQATDAILKALALRARDPSNGGMPGSLSDADRQFLVNMLPGLNKLPGGNRQLIEIMTSLEQRKIDEAGIVNRMQAAKRPSNEIRDAVDQFGRDRPLFKR